MRVHVSVRVYHVEMRSFACAFVALQLIGGEERLRQMRLGNTGKWHMVCTGRSVQRVSDIARE